MDAIRHHMKLVFSEIKNDSIFEEDFLHLDDSNGTIEFKHFSSPGGIAVVYAPNGTGKTSFTNILEEKVSSDNKYFKAINEEGKKITPETDSFQIISNQINRNIIPGKTTDYLVGDQIRKEYALKDKIDNGFEKLFVDLRDIYKTNYLVKRVGHYFIENHSFSSFSNHELAIGGYIRDIVNVRKKSKDIKKEDLIPFIRDYRKTIFNKRIDENKRGFIIQDFSNPQQCVTEKILRIQVDQLHFNQEAKYLEQYNDAITILDKYVDYEYCVVCDNEDFDGKELLKKKKNSREKIYNKLDAASKMLLQELLSNDNLKNNDPFFIQIVIRNLIENNDVDGFVRLQDELKESIQCIEDEMIDKLIHHEGNEELIKDYEEYLKLIEDKPQFESEELFYIEKVINDNIGKNIVIERDESSDKNYVLKLNDTQLLGTDRKNLELSTGEQNFISLAFELLLAKHSDKNYVVIDDPISSLDSIYKNKIAYCIIKFLEDKRQIILTHSIDLIRLLHVQFKNCFNLYFLNNTENGVNGFIPVNNNEKNMLINLHDLISLFQNRGGKLRSQVENQRHYLMSMIPFMRGYAHIMLDSDEYYSKLSNIMHGYNGDIEIDLVLIYNKLFGEIFEGKEEVGVKDLLEVDYEKLQILKDDKYPLLNKTLKQTLLYLSLRLKVEKELVDVFKITIRDRDNTALQKIIEKAFPSEDETRWEDKVFFTSRKTLLNEFNHFEGNLNIFQPAIDINEKALKKEIIDINNKLDEVHEKYRG